MVYFWFNIYTCVILLPLTELFLIFQESGDRSLLDTRLKITHYKRDALELFMLFKTTQKQRIIVSVQLYKSTI